MRAGKLDRTIAIEAFTSGGVDDYGQPIEGWEAFATVRGEIIEASTEEYQRAYGVGGNTSIIFRTRWLDGVTIEHRILYAGRTLNIREVAEIGRRRGLELRCEEVRE